MRGPRNVYRPRKSRSPVKVRNFSTEYAALVHARIHNPRLALQGKKTFNRLVITGPTGKREVDLFRNYVPPKGSHYMPAVYAIISSRTWPETRLEHTLRTLEEAEALAEGNERLKKGRVRDFVILSSEDKRMLAKFQEPELRHLYDSMHQAGLPEEVSYNELLNKVAKALAEHPCETVPANLIEAYRKKQRSATASHAEIVAPKTSTNIAKETKTMNTQTETTAGKISRKAAGKASQKPSKKTAKGVAGGTKGKGKAAKTATNKAAAKGAPKGDGLGREGTLSRFINERIMKGQGNAEIATAAAKAFPKSNSTEAKHVAWSRWKLKQNDSLKVPEAKE